MGHTNQSVDVQWRPFCVGGSWPYMTVFISWAGAPSKALAIALRSFLRVVVQQCSPWMSDRDIGAGMPWDNALETALKEAQFGIVCLTPSNVNNTYLHYEAGAIANQVQNVNHVCPVLLGFENAADLRQPLGRFQAKLVTHDGIWDLVRAINAGLKTPIDESTLREAFEGRWEKLATEIRNIDLQDELQPAPKRNSEEVLEEILEHVRKLVTQEVPSYPPFRYAFPPP